MRTQIEKTRLFFIGRNRRGNWVAKMKHGMVGGGSNEIQRSIIAKEMGIGGG